VGLAGLASLAGGLGLRRAAVAGRTWGSIEFPRQGAEALVAEGVDDATLAVAVGHVPGTAFPGEDGKLGLAGHRDGAFRVLRDVREGNRVRLATPDGVFRYRVDETRVVAPAPRSAQVARENGVKSVSRSKKSSCSTRFRKPTMR
jgi:LPXTG-site transpeptidase (sortase) family protein